MGIQDFVAINFCLILHFFWFAFDIIVINSLYIEFNKSIFSQSREVETGIEREKWKLHYWV